MNIEHLMTAELLMNLSKSTFEAAKDKTVYVAAITTAESRGGRWPDFRRNLEQAEVAEAVAWIAGQAAAKGCFGYYLDLIITIDDAHGQLTIGFQLTRVDEPTLKTSQIALKDLCLPGTVGAHAAWEVISRIKHHLPAAADSLDADADVAATPAPPDRATT